MAYEKPMVTIELDEYMELQKLKKIIATPQMMEELQVYKEFIRCFVASGGNIDETLKKMELQHIIVRIAADQWKMPIDINKEPLYYQINKTIYTRKQ